MVQMNRPVNPRLQVGTTSFIGIPAISSEKITYATNQEPSGCVSSALPLIDLKVARADGEQLLILFQPMDTQLANDDQRL